MLNCLYNVNLFLYKKKLYFQIGWILIDRCGRHFGTILSYLRDGSVPLPDSTREIAELLAEAKYYLIQELSECCESALRKREMDLEPICRVPLITSSKEEQMLINSSTKVCSVNMSCVTYQ